MANIYQTGGKAVGKALSKLKSKGAPKATKEAAEGTTDEWTKAQAGRAALDLEEQQARITSIQEAFTKEKESLLSGDKGELQRGLSTIDAAMNDAIGTPRFKELRLKRDLYEAALSGDKKKVDEAYAAFKPVQIEKNKDEDALEAWRQYSMAAPKQTTAIAPTPGAKLSRVEPVAEAEYIPPTGPEERKLLPPGPGTALVPTGYGRTTFIAGERGISAGEPEKVLGPTREMAVFSEPGPFEERIRAGLREPRPQADATVADRISASQKLTNAQKAGVGLAAAGAAGMALRGGEEKKPEQPAGLLRPKITGETYADIKFEPSPAELEEANSKAGMAGVRALWNTYSALNDEFQNRVKTEGFTTSDPKAAASAFLQTKQPATGPGMLAKRAEPVAPSAPIEPTPTPKTQITPQVAPAVDMKKEQQAVLTTPPGGVAAKPRPQTKTIAESISGQVKTAETAQDAASAITDKLASGQQLTRADMLGLVEKINSIQPTPAQADDATIKALKAAREDARQAYREQATRNEWYEVAQTVSNAIANFIAAQQGLAGKPLALPQVDYGERTARALREYQTELGAITEQERALERGVERKQAAAEREAEASRRGWERYLMLGEKQIEAAERKAAQERDLAAQLSIATAKREQEKAALQAAAKKEEKKAAKEGGKEQLSFLEKSIRQTEDLIKEAENKLKNATAVAAAADSKAFSEALPAYSLGAGVDLSQYTKAGIFSGEKYQQDEIKKQARGRAAELSAELQRLAKIRDDKLNQYDAAISGGQPISPAPTGQEPAAGGKVISRAEVADYAKNQGATLKQATSFLIGQGYTIQD